MFTFQTYNCQADNKSTKQKCRKIHESQRVVAIMAATGVQAMSDTTSGKAVAPGDVLASSDDASAQSKTILRPPTSEQIEQRNQNRRQLKKKKLENLTIEIPKEKKEEEKRKQLSLKEFLQFAKMKNNNKDNKKQT